MISAPDKPMKSSSTMREAANRLAYLWGYLHICCENVKLVAHPVGILCEGSFMKIRYGTGGTYICALPPTSTIVPRPTRFLKLLLPG